MVVTLKLAQPQDWEKILQMEQAVQSPVYFAYTEEAEIKKYMDGSQIYLLINEDQQNVGTVSYEIKDNGVSHFNGLIVLPDYRGRGYGLQAIREVIKTIGEDKKMDLVVHPHNSSAIATYLKAGFVISGWEDDSFGDGQPRIEMTRPI